MTGRILLVDDHETLRRGVRSLIEAQPGLGVVGEASTGRDAVTQAKRLQPDLVILDVSMPGLNGVEATRQIRKACPSAEVLVFTMHESEELASEVLQAGASGYLVKSDAAEELVSAVRTVLDHRPYFTSRVGRMVLRSLRGAGGEAVPRGQTTGRLTPREREVLQLVAEGKTNKEIAVELNLSVETARTHRTNILRKLNLHSSSELVRYAIRNRIVQA